MTWTPSEIEALLAISSVAGGATLGVIKLITKPVKIITEGLEEVKSELRANGGSSLKDIVIQTRDLSLMTLAIQDATLETSELAHWRSAADGKYVFANAKLCSLMGRQPNEVLGDGWRTCISPKDVERVSHIWDDCITQHRNFEAVYEYVRPDGTCTPRYRVRAQILRNANGVVVGFLGTIVGIATDE